MYTCVVCAESVALLFVGLLGSGGVLRDRGQRRSGHAGRLQDLDVLTGQTRHQLLAGGAACEQELVGEGSQNPTRHRPDPEHLRAEGHAMWRQRKMFLLYAVCTA